MPLGNSNNHQFDDLVGDIQRKIEHSLPNTQIWIGIAGAPGSGKSTLAEALKSNFSQSIVVIPMDGYHYYRKELIKFEKSLNAEALRGAPFTFNSTRFVNELVAANLNGEGSFPSFDHSIGDPIENNIQLFKHHKIVLVEGNYLLLDSEPWCQLREKVFDETWFLSVPIEECMRRVISRHKQTGLAEEEASFRVKNNDRTNAQLVIGASPKNADKIVQLI